MIDDRWSVIVSFCGVNRCATPTVQFQFFRLIRLLASSRRPLHSLLRYVVVAVAEQAELARFLGDSGVFRLGSPSDVTAVSGDVITISGDVTSDGHVVWWQLTLHTRTRAHINNSFRQGRGDASGKVQGGLPHPQLWHSVWACSQCILPAQHFLIYTFRVTKKYKKILLTKFVVIWRDVLFQAENASKPFSAGSPPQTLLGELTRLSHITQSAEEFRYSSYPSPYLPLLSYTPLPALSTPSASRSRRLWRLRFLHTHCRSRAAGFRDTTDIHDNSSL